MAFDNGRQDLNRHTWLDNPDDNAVDEVLKGGIDEAAQL